MAWCIFPIGSNRTARKILWGPWIVAQRHRITNPKKEGPREGNCVAREIHREGTFAFTCGQCQMRVHIGAAKTKEKAQALLDASVRLEHG
jgi:hypothetical protein